MARHARARNTRFKTNKSRLIAYNRVLQACSVSEHCFLHCVPAPSTDKSKPVQTDRHVQRLLHEARGFLHLQANRLALLGQVQKLSRLSIAGHQLMALPAYGQTTFRAVALLVRATTLRDDVRMACEG
jgi:hypothetical protein